MRNKGRAPYTPLFPCPRLGCNGDSTFGVCRAARPPGLPRQQKGEAGEIGPVGVQAAPDQQPAADREGWGMRGFMGAHTGNSWRGLLTGRADPGENPFLPSPISLGAPCREAQSWLCSISLPRALVHSGFMFVQHLCCPSYIPSLVLNTSHTFSLIPC